MKNFYTYLPVTESEEKLGFYITTVGFKKTHPREAYPPPGGHPKTHTFTWNKGRVLNGYYIIYIAQGQGVFETEYTSPIKISEGSCLFLFPHVWHRYKPQQNTGWEEYWIGFEGSYPDTLMKGLLFNRETPFVNIGLPLSVLDLFQRLINMVQSQSPGYSKIIPGITIEILGLINVISNNEGINGDGTKQLIQKSKFLLKEAIDQKINLKHLAQQLPMGYSKFRKEFKKEVGQSPLEFHLNLKLNKAEELLKTTTFPIKEIAYDLGFESVFYFSKFFKSRTGLSPKSYREKKTAGSDA